MRPSPGLEISFIAFPLSIVLAPFFVNAFSSLLHSQFTSHTQNKRPPIPPEVPLALRPRSRLKVSTPHPSPLPRSPPPGILKRGVLPLPLPPAGPRKSLGISALRSVSPAGQGST